MAPRRSVESRDQHPCCCLGCCTQNDDEAILRPSFIVWGQRVMGLTGSLPARDGRACPDMFASSPYRKNRYGRSLCRVSTFVQRCESQSAMGEVEVTARDVHGVF